MFVCRALARQSSFVFRVRSWTDCLRFQRKQLARVLQCARYDSGVVSVVLAEDAQQQNSDFALSSGLTLLADVVDNDADQQPAASPQKKRARGTGADSDFILDENRDNDFLSLAATRARREKKTAKK